MLIRVTNACTMGCAHCIVDARPDGEMMTRETFDAAVDLCYRLGDPILILSGGEPTGHPHLLDLLKSVRKHFETAVVYILSNGEFFYERDRAWADALLSSVDGVQVTNDARYYPREVKPFTHPKVKHETAIRRVTPLGRAKGRPLPEGCRGPQCFNLRSATRALGLALSVGYVRSRGFFCTPSIDVDGTVRAGESPYCSNIGDASSSISELEAGLSNPPCNACGAASTLNYEARLAIGLPQEEL